jgi:hypothetical protein
MFEFTYPKSLKETNFTLASYPTGSGKEREIPPLLQDPTESAFLTSTTHLINISLIFGIRPRVEA